MSNMKRRAILIGGITVLLAGCSANQEGDESDPDTPEPTPTPRPDSDGDGVPDVEDDYPEDSSYSTFVNEEADTRQVPEDSWYAEEFGLTETATLFFEFVVRSGPAIDVFLLDESEYDQLRAENRFRIYTGGSVLDAKSGNATITLSPGSYYVIFDNTSAGEAQPPANLANDIAEVEYRMVLAR